MRALTGILVVSCLVMMNGCISSPTHSVHGHEVIITNAEWEETQEVIRKAHGRMASSTEGDGTISSSSSHRKELSTWTGLGGVLGCARLRLEFHYGERRNNVIDAVYVPGRATVLLLDAETEEGRRALSRHLSASFAELGIRRK